jgi:hypothetical protein
MRCLRGRLRLIIIVTIDRKSCIRDESDNAMITVNGIALYRYETRPCARFYGSTLQERGIGMFSIHRIVGIIITISSQVLPTKLEVSSQKSELFKLQTSDVRTRSI